jgi:hypothetical protein
MHASTLSGRCTYVHRAIVPAAAAVFSVGVILGSFATWVEVPGFSFSGVDGIGVPVLVLGILALVASAAHATMQRRATAVALALLGAFAAGLTLAVWALVHAAGKSGDVVAFVLAGSEHADLFENAELVSLGWGLVFTGLSASALAVTGMAALFLRPKPADYAVKSEDSYGGAFDDDVETPPYRPW